MLASMYLTNDKPGIVIREGDAVDCQAIYVWIDGERYTITKSTIGAGLNIRVDGRLVIQPVVANDVNLTVRQFGEGD